MLPVTATTIRLFLHVLAATVWVGGQITLAGLLPSLRGLGDDAPRKVARQFNRIAWPAFAVLVVTGLWNIYAHTQRSGSTIEWQITLFVKLFVVAAAGISAAAHAGAHSRQALAFWGAVSGLTSLGALFLGVLLAAG